MLPVTPGTGNALLDWILPQVVEGAQNVAIGSVRKHNIEIGAGQFAFSLKQAATALNISTKPIRRMLDDLVTDGYIRMTTKGYCTVVTLCNGVTLRSREDPQETAKGHAKGHAKVTLSQNSENLSRVEDTLEAISPTSLDIGKIEILEPLPVNGEEKQKKDSYKGKNSLITSGNQVERINGALVETTNGSLSQLLPTPDAGDLVDYVSDPTPPTLFESDDLPRHPSEKVRIFTECARMVLAMHENDPPNSGNPQSFGAAKSILGKCLSRIESAGGHPRDLLSIVEAYYQRPLVKSCFPTLWGMTGDRVREMKRMI